MKTTYIHSSVSKFFCANERLNFIKFFNCQKDNFSKAEIEGILINAGKRAAPKFNNYSAIEFGFKHAEDTLVAEYNERYILENSENAIELHRFFCETYRIKANYDIFCKAFKDAFPETWSKWYSTKELL